MIRTKVIYIIWIIVSGLAYVISESPAAAAMVIMAVIYGLFAFVMVMISGRKLTCDIPGGISVDKGAPANLHIDTQNSSRIPVPSCRMTLDCKNVLTEEHNQVPLSYSYGPKGKNSGGIELTGERCGKERLALKDAEVTDPVRLFRRKIQMNFESSCYVMPEIKEIDIPSEYLDSYDMESYTYSQRKQGQDTGEVFGVRDYRDGDSPKQIHWKLSAKMDDLMVKIPSYPIENKLIVLLDNSLASTDGLTPDKRSELIELFFSLSHTLLKKNIPHSLGWVDHESDSFVMERVTNEDEMWAAVHKALGAGIKKAAGSVAYRFLGESGEERFTNHFIVTTGEPLDTQRLEEFGAVRVFRCQ